MSGLQSKGHSALTCIYWFDQAYTTTSLTTIVNFSSSYLLNPNWYPNIATTNHITSYLSKINLQAARYHSEDTQCVGDGFIVLIFHFGSGSFSSSSSKILLKKICCIPSFKKNLISVRQFFVNNNFF